MEIFSESRYCLPFLDTNFVVKYTAPKTIKCLSIGRMSPVLEIKMSLIWGTFSSLGDDVLIYLDCSAQFTLKKCMLKPDWETPA